MVLLILSILSLLLPAAAVGAGELTAIRAARLVEEREAASCCSLC